uniref:Carboxylic ester hydrolase n=1 Tax=Cupiennius salei TaxID=6928 RepID=T1E1P0_CUPSA
MTFPPPKFLWKGLLWIYVAAITSCESIFLTSEGNAPMADTSLGKIIGSTIEVKGIPVHQFLSIPYAKPPTGERRFKKPEPMEAWSVPVLATTEPPACVQYTQNPFPWYDNKTGKSEDCLFLNIWTPLDAGHASTKAVLFWIYGGGFFVGSTRQEDHSGEALAALGDIIVVTVGYRLGSLGFLYSGSSDAPGNVGLWDILAGLQWINDHIQAFGGDPSRITIAGESAGSIAVGQLAVSPLSQGLFAKLIMQSGSPAYTLADNNTQSLVRSQKIAELVNCANSTFNITDNPTEVVECLQGVDAVKLLKVESSLIPRSSRSFLPQYGDEILPQNPREAIISGNFQKKSLLIGNSKDEGAFQITTSNPDLFGFFGAKDPPVNKSTGENLLRRMFAAFPDTESVVRHYLPESIPEDDYETVRFQVCSASGDFSLLCPSVYFAEKVAENGSDVYYYLWAHRPSNSPWAPWMGSPHYSEVQFLFGLPIKEPERYESEEVGLSMGFIHMWSNFMKYGKPVEQWPLYSKEIPVFVYVGVETEAHGTGPHKDNCDFFRPYFGF